MLNQKLMQNLIETHEEKFGDAFEDSLREANLANADLIQERIEHLKECLEDLGHKHGGIPLSQLPEVKH